MSRVLSVDVEKVITPNRLDALCQVKVKHACLKTGQVVGQHDKEMSECIEVLKWALSAEALTDVLAFVSSIVARGLEDVALS